MRRTMAAIAVGLALSGCATYQARPIAPAAMQHAFEQRSLASPALREFLRANDTVGRDGTWDLSRLTYAALYYHPDLAVALAKWRAAQAAAITAGARPNPSLNASSEYNADAPDGTSPWTRGGSLSIPVETAGKRRQRIAQAVQLAEAARLALADSAWQVRSRVRSSLLGVLSTEPLLRRQQTLETERVRLMQRRVELGFAAQPDLTLARIALQQVTLAADEAHKRLAENRAALASALGVPIAALDNVALALDEFGRVPGIKALPSQALRRDALLHRPDLLAALAEYQASEAALKLEVARQYPDLTLSPGLLWDAGQAKWSLGLSLVLPLLNRNEGPIAEARARREQAAANVLLIQTRAIGEVEQAWAGYRAALEKLRSADALLQQQRRKTQSVERLRRAGETERSTLLGAQVEAAAAEVSRQETLLQVQQALGALEDAIRQPVGAAAAFVPLDAIHSVLHQQDHAP